MITFLATKIPYWKNEDKSILKDAIKFDICLPKKLPDTPRGSTKNGFRGPNFRPPRYLAGYPTRYLAILYGLSTRCLPLTGLEHLNLATKIG